MHLRDKGRCTYTTPAALGGTADIQLSAVIWRYGFEHASEANVSGPIITLDDHSFTPIYLTIKIFVETF